MTENEMIEEMTKIIDKRCGAGLGQVSATKYIGECAVTQTTDTRIIAKALYDNDCRIVSDGAVVLTREELERDVTFHDLLREVYRKETAREIFEKLREKCMFDGYPYGVDYKEICEIANEYGVEVEE